VDRLTHLALIAVGGCGVDEAVARAECHADGISGLFGRCLEDPKSERGHLHPVVQFQGRSGGLGHGQARSSRIGVDVGARSSRRISRHEFADLTWVNSEPRVKPSSECAALGTRFPSADDRAGHAYRPITASVRALIPTSPVLSSSLSQ
jgi:hypothetical protein